MSFEEKMKQDLKKDLEIPEIVEQKIQDAYKEIGQGKLRMKKPDNRNQKRKKVWTAAALHGGSFWTRDTGFSAQKNTRNFVHLYSFLSFYLLKFRFFVSLLCNFFDSAIIMP